MKGDFSRQTFDAAKGYTAVLMQQGRVQLDADWNEAQAIHAQRLESALRDVVGPTGALKDLAGADGFRVTTAAREVRVGPGVFYVDGIRVENAQQVSLSAAQPFPTGAPWPATAGPYLVYLDVWGRHVTALEDPAIRETALGGPDTATRVQTVWQARLRPLAAGVTCATIGPVLDDMARRSASRQPGKLAARPSQTSGGAPCEVPPDAGYRGLENQLYRVEVSRAGNLSTARFKWSRENGSVVTRVTAGDASSLTVAGLGRDEALGFAATQWVEYVDDDTELAGRSGPLLRINSVLPHTSKLTFAAPTVVPAVVPAKNPRLRRWDHGGTSAEGIATTDGVWFELEAGVEVRLVEGNYEVGDYWLIPARTATGAEQGSVPWPRTGTTPTPVAPHGTTHHYAALAIVQGTADPVDTSKLLFAVTADCRARFPSLTQITAGDVRYDNSPCAVEGLPATTTVQAALNALCQREWEYGITISPVPGWPSRFGRLDPARGGYVRLRPGDFPTSSPVVVEGTGDLTVIGAGLSSRILASGTETALRFKGWRSVTVRDLYAEADRADDDPNHDLNGVLSFVGCGEVTVEGVVLRCADGDHRAASCLDVRFTPPEPASIEKAVRYTARPPMKTVKEIRYSSRDTSKVMKERAASVMSNDDGTTGMAAKERMAGATEAERQAQAEAEKERLAGATRPATREVHQMVGVDKRRRYDVQRGAAPAAETKDGLPRAVRIRECRLEVGRSQVGVLVLNAARTVVEDCVVHGPPGAATPLLANLGQPQILRWLQRTLVRNLGELTWGDHEPPADVVVVDVGGSTFHFRTVQLTTVKGDLQKMWQHLLDDAMKAEEERTGRHTSLYTVDDQWRFTRFAVGWAIADAKRFAAYAPLATWLKKLHTQNLPAAAQGIVVAGRAAGEVRVHGNTITRVGEGIHVGLGDRSVKPQPVIRQRPVNVQITRNTVQGWASPASPFERYGIYVAGGETVRVEDNDLVLQRPTGVPAVRVEGIRLRGWLGRMVLVRANQLSGYSVGIAALPQGPIPQVRRWVLADNLAADAQHTYEDPGSSFEKTGNKP